MPHNSLLILALKYALLVCHTLQRSRYSCDSFFAKYCKYVWLDHRYRSEYPCPQWHFLRFPPRVQYNADGLGVFLKLNWRCAYKRLAQGSESLNLLAPILCDQSLSDGQVGHKYQKLHEPLLNGVPFWHLLLPVSHWFALPV